ncbi:TRAP transporter substrate-binding protein DctP [Teichococcus vastitatis]|uniref:TRAP transporter substrate-binding protein DctP n=1 Tax=Teichococcus vastitatis TaxID=2307076 RepID=A0ABS9W5F9_9PROT|nr:TRAP transporter substrate-binding protein DctP [Pseudoroseomonas vastitatis]MCI0754537.1 TRAP transporter substrate-binding protein DctP [Pseudoroseomonas vastitatis]
MHRRHLLLATATGFATGVALPAIGRAQEAVTMRLSHQYPPAHHMGQAIARFAERVKTDSQGGINVQVFPAEQLAKANENFPGVARGAFEAAAAVNIQWGNTLPEMSAVSLPYLFTDLAKIRKFPGSDAASQLDALLQKRAVRNLMWLYTTRQAIFTSNARPIVKIEDFKGLKIRGLNALTDHGLAAAGAAPSAMPGPDVPQALQSGVLDAGLTDLSAGVSRRFYEFQKFGTAAPYFCALTHVYVNPRWWSGLKPEQQSVLTRAAQATEQEQFPLTEAVAGKAVTELREKGMTVHQQTPEEAASWAAVMQKPVVDAFLRQAPENGRRLLDALQAL